MKTHSPVVSVLMPVFNGERYLSEAILGILDQTFSDFELIIIDDGSTDQTPTIIQQYTLQDKRIRGYKNADNQGIARSLNTGISKCNGMYIARFDSDDLCHPDRLREQTTFLNQNPDVGILGSRYKTIDETGKTLYVSTQPQSDPAIRWEMLYHNPFSHSSVMIRKEIVQNCGGYGDSVLYAEDYDLWSRVLKVTKGAILPGYFVIRRERKDNVSNTNKSAQIENAALIKAREVNHIMENEFVTAEEMMAITSYRHLRDLVSLSVDPGLICKWMRIFRVFMKQLSNTTDDEKEPIRNDMDRKLTKLFYFGKFDTLHDRFAYLTNLLRFDPFFFFKPVFMRETRDYLKRKFSRKK